MTRVENVRRSFDKKAQVALDQARARRIMAEAAEDLASAKSSRSPQDAALYVLAMHSLTRKVEEKPANKLRLKAKPAEQSLADRVFGPSKIEGVG
jgi:hypothetical protein